MLTLSGSVIQPSSDVGLWSLVTPVGGDRYDDLKVFAVLCDWLLHFLRCSSLGEPVLRVR